MAGITTRAGELAAQLEEVNSKIVSTVTDATGAQWRQQSPSEGWSVGVLAHHCAQVQGFFAGVMAGSEGREPSPTTLTSQVIEENNARHARDFADVGKSETLDALRVHGAAAVRHVSSLTDERLDQAAVVFDGQELNWSQVVEGALIGHLNEHLASMRATIAG